MSLKKFTPILFLFFTLIISGCTEEALPDNKTEVKAVESVESEDTEILYQNEEHGLTISENLEWELESEKETDNLNIVLKHNKLKAIVSSVSSANSFEDIKTDLFKGAGNVSLVQDKEDFISFESSLKDSIRTDVYFRNQDDADHYIIIFMSQASNYDDNQEKIESLLSHINLN